MNFIQVLIVYHNNNIEEMLLSNEIENLINLKKPQERMSVVFVTVLCSLLIFF
jgi:hypothetical protein